MASEGNLAVTVTRGNVGVWDLKTGQLLTKLADNALGAIVTHALISPDAKYIISAESGNVLIWNRLTEQVLFKEAQPNIKQLILMNNENFVLTASHPTTGSALEPNRVNATVIVRKVPGKHPEMKFLIKHFMTEFWILDGSTTFSFEYPIKLVSGTLFKSVVQTADSLHLAAVGVDKNNKDCIYVHHAQTGAFIHKFGLKPGMKDVAGLVTMPNKGSWIGVILSDKGAVYDAKSKKYVRTVPKWCGSCTSDSKYGLYAPSR